MMKYHYHYLSSLQNNNHQLKPKHLRYFLSNGQTYIDKWYIQTVKDVKFYERCASSKNKCYFYTIDLQGRLYLEDTLPKNIATSLKDVKFLNFFFSRIRRVTIKDHGILQNALMGDDVNSSVENNALAVVLMDYPFVSPCGTELNFIRPADTPIVFHDLQESVEQEGRKNLIFGGSLSQLYNPQKLSLSRRTKLLYHELTNTSTKKLLTPLHEGRSQLNLPEYGLIKSSVAITISDAIMEGESFENEVMCYETGNKFPLKWLPDEAEAGDYRFPFLDELCD